jgi:membrane fusion protein (multidrug efflux system)
VTSSAEPDTRAGFARAGGDRDVPVTTRPARRPLRQRLRLPLMILGPVLVLLVAAWWYLMSGRYVTTDDAYVQAARTMVSADVSGRVVAVAVHDNERVSRGQVMFRLDDKTFRIAVEEAKAALASARLNVKAMQATYNQKLADLKAAEETLAYQQREYDRQRQLLANGNAPRSTFDQVQNAMQVAHQKVMSAQSDLANMLAQLGGDPNLPVNDHPTVQKAQAALDKAEYDLERTVVRAPEAGIVTKVDQLQVGSYVTAAAPVFPMVSDRVWVEANFKETELTHMRPGQMATVEIDTYPDAVLQARVESLSPGTGLTFSLLPAENATGNWVKVVQRLPVRLSLIKPPADLPLHAGLSATVEVDTHHSNPWLVWLTDKAGPLFGTARAGAPPAQSR